MAAVEVVEVAVEVVVGLLVVPLEKFIMLTSYLFKIVVVAVELEVVVALLVVLSEKFIMLTSHLYKIVVAAMLAAAEEEVVA